MTASTDQPRSLAPSFAAEEAHSFRTDTFGRIVQNAVSAQGADAVSLDRDVVNRIDDSTSERLDSWAVTDQKHSGRCWAFAALNVLRARMVKELHLDDFVFSQNFIAFHDKLEKANHLLVRAIETVDDPLGDEGVRNLLNGVGDGGFWTQFLDLVRKYGLVPVWAMPDTESAGNTDQMNRALAVVLRRGVGRIRAARTDVDSIRLETMKDVWRILAIHLGTPPTSFVWQYRDADKVFHPEGVMTPLEFAEKYVPAEIFDYVVLTHDPREEHPEGRRYIAEHSPYMEGRPPYSQITAPIGDLKKAAVGAIRDGEPVYFTCDVKKQFDKERGIWDARLHDYGALYGVGMEMTKAERMRLHDTGSTHAMTLVGVDLVDGRPRRWRVENSWGDEVGRKGFFTMDDSWFDEYVFRVAVAPERLTQAQRAARTEEPLVLPEWDVI